MHYRTTCRSPVGTLTLAGDGENLVGLWIEGQKYHGGALGGPLARRDDAPVFRAAREWLGRYFAGEKPAVSGLPLAPAGGAFRQGVWEILRAIPYGETATYGDVAREMALRTGRARMSARAVGGAVGHNPISIIIPCHRVVGADGSLTGYAGGLATKIRLLGLEGVDMSGLHVPRKGSAT
ncbi:MAG: methylated-DNA--[protein]-cysteine S-methyltransferase [Deltaproteobacteria bacterium]|nr:methylated-DNA--[protein]-cysteine S-methyltransferase [Deltaproteobacteria bacterium]